MISASRVGPASATCQTHTNRKDHEISPGYSRIKSDSLVSFLGDFSFSVGVLCVNLSWYAFHSRGYSGNDDSNTFWFSPTPEIIHRPIFSRLMAYAAYDMHLFLKCPKIEPIHFRFSSRFQIDHMLCFRNVELFYIRNSWNAPFFSFSESDRNNGAFREKSTWSICKRRKNRNWIGSILGHLKNKCISYAAYAITNKIYPPHIFWDISRNP